MASTAVDAQCLDSYRNFTLRLRDGNRTYSGNVRTGLFPPPEVVHEQTGGDPSSPRKLTGLNKNEDITLKRGVTHDTTFSTWASQVWDFGSGMGSEVSSANFRRDIFLEFYNETGQLVVRYRIYGSNVSETPVLPPGGVFHHFLHPRGHRSIQEQLVVIFQNSLRRYRP
jgi:phage tail-like protein